MQRCIRRTLLALVMIGIALQSIGSTLAESPDESEPITVGWIGGLTGGTAKWGAYQAALLGIEEVNENGGINGRPLKVIFEDAHCSGAAAVSAFRKLTEADGISFLLGGHCSPESLAIAPLAQRKRITSIAAITSSPKLTAAGDFVFRVTPVSTRLADLLVPHAQEAIGIKKVALIYELTDYAEPVAERFAELVEQRGGIVSTKISFAPGESDFRPLLLKASQGSPNLLYLGVQAPDTAALLIKQNRELGLTIPIFGNEQFAGAFLVSDQPTRASMEGVTFAEPECDQNIPEIRMFAKRYKERYEVENLPFGCYTAEPYDSVKLLARALKACGEDVDCVKQQLYSITEYQGASGKFGFDRNGDVDKKYLIKIIRDGRIRSLSST